MIALLVWVLLLAPTAAGANLGVRTLTQRAPPFVPWLAGWGAVTVVVVPVFALAAAPWWHVIGTGTYLVRAGMLAGLVAGVVDIPLSWSRNVRAGESLGRIYAEAGVVGLPTLVFLNRLAVALDHAP